VRRPRLEVADVFDRHGADWRRANAGHVSLNQLQVMSAIEQCRSAALGGHVERCEDCGHSRIAYNSCRNRHCPKCQGAAAQDWLAAREADLLPVSYFHVVFTLPAEIAPIAYQNKAVVYDLLFRTAAETLLTIAPTGQARGLKAHDPKHLGARIGATAVLHTWGSAMTHHPHVHMIVPGGGISLDRVGGFLTIPPSHTTGRTDHVPRRFPWAFNAKWRAVRLIRPSWSNHAMFMALFACSELARHHQPRPEEASSRAGRGETPC
jgi:hypothetical protein